MTTTMKPSEFGLDELLTIAEVADVLRVDPTTVKRWIARGAMHAVELPNAGRRHIYRVKQSTVDTLVGGKG